MTRAWLVTLESFASQDKADVRLQPGALELFTALRESGSPCALVTADLGTARLLLRKVPEARVFRVLTQHWGSAELNAFERAALGLEVQPADCLAVVGSDLDVVAARAASCDTVIGVGTMICQAPACQPGILAGSLADVAKMITEATTKG